MLRRNIMSYLKMFFMRCSQSFHLYLNTMIGSIKEGQLKDFVACRDEFNIMEKPFPYLEHTILFKCEYARIFSNKRTFTLTRAVIMTE